MLAGRGVVLEDVVQDRDLALQCPERLCREAAGVLPDPDERRGDHANRRLIHAPQNEFEILGQGAAEGLDPSADPTEEGLTQDESGRKDGLVAEQTLIQRTSRTKASGPILRPGMSQKPGGASSNFVPADQIWPVTTLKFVKSVSDINAQSRKPPPLRGVTGTRQPVALAAPSLPPPYVQHVWLERLARRLGVDWEEFLQRRFFSLMHPKEIGALDPTIADVQLHPSAPRAGAAGTVSS